MHITKFTYPSSKSRFCLAAAVAVLSFVVSVQAFAADLTLRAGFAVTTNPYVEAVTVFGRVRSTATTPPAGALLISFSTYLTCTLRNPSGLTSVPDAYGKVTTVSGVAACNNGVNSTPFNANTILTLRFNSTGGFRDGRIELTAVENGETAAFDLIRSKPQIVYVP